MSERLPRTGHGVGPGGSGCFGFFRKMKRYAMPIIPIMTTSMVFKSKVMRVMAQSFLSELADTVKQIHLAKAIRSNPRSNQNVDIIVANVELRSQSSDMCS
jgi:hypothetical protein